MQNDRIATIGNSFGGIEVILAMAGDHYCAGVNAAGGAQSWRHSEELRTFMKNAVLRIRKPVFSFKLRTIMTCRQAGFCHQK